MDLIITRWLVLVITHLKPTTTKTITHVTSYNRKLQYILHHKHEVKLTTNIKYKETQTIIYIAKYNTQIKFVS